MPPPLLFDIQGVDLVCEVLTASRLYELLPQRHEFALLNGACHVDVEQREMVAYADVRMDDWWVRGHVPGRPLLPGVLMLEMAAQSAGALARLVGGGTDFIGFGGVEDCKFRDAVVPPARLHILCKGVDYRPRRIVCDTQGVIDGRLIFEARIVGVVMK